MFSFFSFFLSFLSFFLFFIFFFNDTATTEIYTLSLHDALPISPDLEVLSEYKISSEAPARADFIISDNSSRVVIELKRARSGRQLIDTGVAQVERYMLLSNINAAILFLFSELGDELDIQERNVSNIDGKMLILQPEKLRPNGSGEVD